MSKRARTEETLDPIAARAAESEACLFPAIEPYATGYVEAGMHKIYYEECGIATGQPVIILHGGPGAGCSAKQRRFHDPAKHRIVLFDQRGCGRSTPDGCLEDNTTWHLVADIERLRELLGIERWQVFGGSWGSTLALAYGITHPERVTALVLRGIFLVKKAELDFIYQTATPLVFPAAYEALRAPIPPTERSDLVSAYRKRVMSADAKTSNEHARRWCEWEDSISQLHPAPLGAWEGSGGEQKIHLHYMWHRGFFEYDGWLLDHLAPLRDIPCTIVHGKYDLVCPPASAHELHQALQRMHPPGACVHQTLAWAADSGHSAWEPATTRALVDAVKAYAERGGR